MTAPAPDQRSPQVCPACNNWCVYDGWGHVHANGIGIGSCTTHPSPETKTLTALIAHLQHHRGATLRALRACANGSSPDYFRWQGHAELARQLLQRLNAEVPQ